jgi:hypothetical protein
MLLILFGISDAVAAQDEGPALRRHHLTFSAGFIWSGGYTIGDRNAELRRNATGTPAPFTFFTADSVFERTNGAEARVGFAFARSLALEVGATYARPRLAITVTGDSETDGPVVIGEDVSQYTIDLSGVYQLPGMSLGSRIRPYVTGGGGYIRHLHEARELAETGRTLHVGGGVRLWLRGGSAVSRALGIRADTRFVYRTGGVDFEDKARGYPVFSVLGFAGF